MKHVMQRLLEQAGKKTRTYSGRFMFGRECLGVVLHTAHDLVPAIMEQISLNPLPAEELKQLTDALNETTYDDMGKDTIVYWPHVKYFEETTA